MTDTSLVAPEDRQDLIAAVKSEMWPERFSGPNAFANAAVLYDLAQRAGISPVALAQKAYFVKGGEVALEAQAVMAMLNQSGELAEPLYFEYDGSFEDDTLTCTAIGRYKDSPIVRRATVELVAQRTKNDMYKNKDGASQKLSYDAAIFWGRRNASHLLMGVRTLEEKERIEADALVEVPAIEVSSEEALDVFASQEEEPTMEDALGPAMTEAELASEETPEEPPEAPHEELEAEQPDDPPVGGKRLQALLKKSGEVGVGIEKLEQLAVLHTGSKFNELTKSSADKLMRFLLNMEADEK